MAKRIFSIFTACLALFIAGTPASRAQDVAAAFASRLAAFDAAFEAKRLELAVPGAALVIVKDGKVVHLKGYGHRDIASKAPVTPDTLFQIASASKAFTALAVMMQVDDGKLKLADRPVTYVPDFKISNPAIDQAITVFDLLTHRSGLPRTDAAWVIGQGLTRPELIRAIGTLKPTAKLGAKWQYQNMLYVAAGEVAASAAGTSFEQLVSERIFKPLGLKSASFDHARFLAAPDRVTGYDNTGSEQVPLLDSSVIAAAGGIIASARDMGEWVRFMLASGQVAGRPLVRAASFAELVKPQMPVGGSMSYGLGWMVQEQNGNRIVEHGGDLPGIQTEVALLPAKGIGFALLTNSSSNNLRDAVMPMAWSYLASDAPLPAPTTAASGLPVDRREAGTYAFGGYGQDFAVRYTKDGKLVLNVPAQPAYTLVAVGERRYKFQEVDGFLATFRPATNDPTETELHLKQPHGDVVLPKRRVRPLVDAQQAMAGLVGLYAEKASKAVTAEIANIGGKLALLIPGQPAYPLVIAADNKITLAGLGNGTLVVRRSAKNEVIGFGLSAPSGKHEFEGPSLAKSELTLEQINEQVVAAHGGRERIASVKSITGEFQSQKTGEGQGLTQSGTFAGKNGYYTATIGLFAFGKPSGVLRSTASASGVSIRKDNEPAQAISGDMLTMLLADAYLQEPLQWQSIYRKVTLIGIRRVDNRPVYAVSKVFHSGAVQIDSYDAETFLWTRRLFKLRGADGASVDIITRYSDFRPVDGYMVPHRTVTSTQGDASREITVYSNVVINAEVSDDTFDISTDLP